MLNIPQQASDKSQSLYCYLRRILNMHQIQIYASKIKNNKKAHEEKMPPLMRKRRIHNLNEELNLIVYKTKNNKIGIWIQFPLCKENVRPCKYIISSLMRF